MTAVRPDRVVELDEDQARDEKNHQPVELDDVLEEVGQFGRFQLGQCLLMVLPIVFNAFSSLCYVFTAGDLTYRCLVPDCENATTATYAADWLPMAVPFVDGVPAQCERYAPWSRNASGEDFTCRAEDFNRQVVTRCNVHVYADPRERTIVSEFGLTCDENRWKVTLVGTVHNVGQFFALLLSGIVSDRFGRRWTLLLTVGIGSTLGILRAFSANYETFLLMEFLEPTFGSTVYTTAFVLGLELVGPKYRVVVNSVALVSFAAGEALLGLLAMFFRDWRTLSFVIFVPALLSLGLQWTTVESVRWLLTNGRRNQAVAILKQAAKTNGRQISQGTLQRFGSRQPTDDGRPQPTAAPTFTDLLESVFKRKRLLLRILNCSFCWLTNVLVYYGLTLNSVSLAGDKYVNFILITLVEVPPCLGINFMLDRFGRRKTQCGSLLVCGLFCFLTLVVPREIAWANMVLFLLSKMAISLSFATIYIYTAEIFPTNLRQSLLSICSMLGRFGSMIAPQMPLLARLWSPLPMLLYGTVAVLSGLTVLEFPETTNTQLPNTVEEALMLRGRVRRQEPPPSE